MKKAIIVGATSGIGYELALKLAKNNYEVGIIGRRTHLLEKLKTKIPTKAYLKTIDVTNTKEATKLMYDLIAEMKTVDLFIVSAGMGHINFELDWEKEKEVIDTNVVGFALMCNIAVQTFKKQGYGHLVGISSIASIRGYKDAPAYFASKAFVSNYLEGLRSQLYPLKIKVLDVKPGFVDTKMGQGDKTFWVAKASKAANQIYQAIKKKKRLVYITKRWRLIAYIIKILPSWLHERI